MACKFHAFDHMPDLTGRTRGLPALVTLLGPLLAALALCAPLPGQAQRAAAPAAPAASRDRDVPLQFDAGQMKIDGKRKVRLLIGNVQLTRGSFWLASQQVELRESPQGGDLAIATSSPSQQAHFKQKREGLDEIIDGRADRIEYDARTEIVRLIGNAMLKRLRGDEVTEQVTGQTIVYEHGKETFEVLGGGAGSRVKGVVTPQPRASEGGAR
jgi:lipopolysaccharide export system protein LptA